FYCRMSCRAEGGWMRVDVTPHLKEEARCVIDTEPGTRSPGPGAPQDAAALRDAGAPRAAEVRGRGGRRGGLVRRGRRRAWVLGGRGAGRSSARPDGRL